jgi:PIN domain nuclease of toxin-antitoxin system
MQLLLDTHTFLWYVFGNTQLSATARALIQDPGNDKFLSMAVPWEVGIKVSTGKLTLSRPLEAYFTEQLVLNSIQMLPITLAHIARVSILPFHHRDPFDRMLVAQSLTENIPLVSADSALDAYGIVRLW